MKRPPSYSEGYISEFKFPYDFKTNLLTINDNNNRTNSIDSSNLLENAELIDSNKVIIDKLSIAAVLAVLLVLLFVRAVCKFARDANKAPCDVVPVVLYSSNFVFKSFNDEIILCEDVSLVDAYAAKLSDISSIATLTNDKL